MTIPDNLVPLWELLKAWGPWLISVALGLLANWLKNGKDIQQTKKEIAKIVGDAIASVALQIHGQMGVVPRTLLIAEADKLYDALVALLPDGMEPIAKRLYTKEDFEDIVLRAWDNWKNRQLIAAHANGR